ncbi:unnamed protein product [Prorocentrum cordatum]|uniref:Uncharacterized protein n=1 Tax=Prorocentrum cordatum TaxID=2364126 RepID=A0ABN9YF34_9DINO|nr:unnamed protein product [Polarella glacialis]
MIERLEKLAGNLVFTEQCCKLAFTKVLSVLNDGDDWKLGEAAQESWITANAGRPMGGI